MLKFSQILWVAGVLHVRTYASKGGALKAIRVRKALQGKVVKEAIKEESVSIRRQKRELQASKEYEENPEGFGDLESDFMDVHKSHKEYEAEAIRYREQVRHWIVKNKYFKEKLPNFLTYAEKEQIKLLNSQNPEEWDPEKLSESFPADPATIAKIIKAKWVARSEKRIRLHDQSVMRNWSLFRENKLPDLRNDLREHLQKFADRTPEDLENVMSDTRVLPELPKPKSSEFVGIITSCKKYREDNKLLEAKETTKDVLSDTVVGGNSSRQDDTFIMGNIHDKRKMRLQDFKKEKLSVNEEDTAQFDQTENAEGTSILQITENNPLKTIEPSEVVISQEDMKTYEVSPIKEKIYIPRKLWKRGATYKVEDCYYDDDGEFLYRVPGMTGRKI